jgi:hypothetical protein
MLSRELINKIRRNAVIGVEFAGPAMVRGEFVYQTALLEEIAAAIRGNTSIKIVKFTRLPSAAVNIFLTAFTGKNLQVIEFEELTRNSVTVLGNHLAGHPKLGAIGVFKLHHTVISSLAEVLRVKAPQITQISLGNLNAAGVREVIPLIQHCSKITWLHLSDLKDKEVMTIQNTMRQLRREDLRFYYYSNISDHVKFAATISLSIPSPPPLPVVTDSFVPPSLISSIGPFKMGGIATDPETAARFEALEALLAPNPDTEMGDPSISSYDPMGFLSSAPFTEPRQERSLKALPQSSQVQAASQQSSGDFSSEVESNEARSVKRQKISANASPAAAASLLSAPNTRRIYSALGAKPVLPVNVDMIQSSGVSSLAEPESVPQADQYDHEKTLRRQQTEWLLSGRVIPPKQQFRP